VPEPVVVSAGRLEAVITPYPAQIEILQAGEVVWSTRSGHQDDTEAPHGFAAVRGATAEIEMLYGSFRFEPGEEGPWRAIDSLGDVRARPGGARFDLLSGGEVVGTGELTLSGGGGDRAGGARIRLTAAGEVNRVSLATPCGADEHMVGLGGQSFDVDHRGHTVPLWVQEDGIGKYPLPDDDYTGIWFLNGRRHSTHTPMPMLLSSRGYALVVDTTARSIFALCSEAEDVARYEVWAPELDMHVLFGDGAGPGAGEAALRGALAGMIDLVGRPPRPPRWAFAPWLDAVLGQDNVQRVADKLRAEGVAVSAIWTEDWRGGAHGVNGFALEEDWRVDRELYPGFEDLADRLHGQGYAFLTYQNTFIEQNADVFLEAVAEGHVMQAPGGGPYMFDGVTFEPTTLLDLSSPAAVAWAQAIYREGLELGADGWMADFSEWAPHDAVLASGEDALAVHNRYPVDWARLNRELMDSWESPGGIEPLFFVRAAWLGSQPLVSVVWAGDQQTDFSEGDGLPSVIPMGIGLGLTGFPYFGHDIAGYMSQGTEPTTEELWQRWVTFGALSPVMRAHHGRALGENHAWETDEAAVAHMRRWTRLHMQLVPYLWGSIGSFERDGLPLFRLIALHWPEEEWAWTSLDQYLLGDRILVAPVVTQGATSRQVMLPPGRWYPLLGGAAIEGGRGVTIEAPPTEIPALVPEGALLVLYPDGVETLLDAPLSPGALTGSEVADDREVWLWPGEPSGAAGIWHDEDGPAGEAMWRWSGRGAGAPASATWNGEPVELTSEEGAVWLEVTGDGVLELEGGGTLTIERGLPEARVRVRLLTP